MSDFARPTIYIAGPYSSGQEAGLRQAIEAFNKLADAGWSPFCPHLSFLPALHKERSWEEWMELCWPWVLRAEALVRLPGESEGADMEVSWARDVGKTIFDSVEDANEWMVYHVVNKMYKW